MINTNFYRLYEVVHPIIWEYWEQNHEMVIATADEEGVKFTGDSLTVQGSLQSTYFTGMET
jgi:hypothetical protein